MPNPNLRPIKGRVSPDEYAAAERFAKTQGVSISGLTTALCRWLDSEQETSPEVQRCIKMLVEEARKVDDERHRRK